MSGKPRIATVSLAGCFGCHMSILDIDERILALAELVEFDRSPINDYKAFQGRCAVGIIEGGCCNEENVHVLEDFRKHCDVLVSLGDCAINGGVPALRNHVPLRECLEEAYLRSPGVYNPGGIIPNDSEIPLLLNRVYPCHEVVKIDCFIPGCPPPADAIWSTLVSLLQGQPVQPAYASLKYDLRRLTMVTAQPKSRTYTIMPLTRVEGHGKVTIRMNPQHEVEQARLHIVEFRGFERFILGRPYWEVPVIVERLCGICPVSHHLAAAKAMDRIVGGEMLTPTAEKIRRLMHYGQIFQSHALHFFHLASPDLLFGTDGTAGSAFSAPVEQRHVLAVAAKYPDLARQAIMMRRFGQEVIKATAGKKIHGTGAIPGGVNKNLSLAERDVLQREIDQMIVWARGALSIARAFTLDHLVELLPFGSFDSSHLGLVREGDGALELYDGVLRVVNKDGERLIDGVDCQRYLDVISEEVRPWSYMKFPFLKALGPEHGWYRVGPLARINTCSFIDTPEAEAARQEFMGLTKGRPNNVTMCYHWARMIELLHAIEKIRDLLHDPDLQGEDLVASGPRREEAVGVIEAPRGTLIHHYRVDRHDAVSMANLIVSTTHNNEPMNRAVTKVARDHFSGKSVITEGLLNHIEVAIRAYDPCLSCATHALGQMALVVEVEDSDGRVVDRRVRGHEVAS